MAGPSATSGWPGNLSQINQILEYMFECVSLFSTCFELCNCNYDAGATRNPCKPQGQKDTQTNMLILFWRPLNLFWNACCHFAKHSSTVKVVFFYKSISTCGVLHAGPSQGMPTLADHFIKSCMEHSLRLLLSGEDFELWVLGAYSREEPCYTAIYMWICWGCRSPSTPHP